MALLYFAVARLSLLLAIPGTNASPVWPPAGIAFAAILVFGYRVWPGIALGAFLANWAQFLSYPAIDSSTRAAVSAVIAAGNTSEAVVGKLLLDCLGGHADLFQRTRSFRRFAAVALGMCLTSSLLGPLVSCLAGIVPWPLFPTVWFTWWIGDVAGILVMTPWLLSWAEPSLPLPKRARRGRETVLFYLVLFAASQTIFGSWFPDLLVLHRPYLIIPMLLWGAFRFGPREITLAVAAVSGIAVFHSAHGSGPFAAWSLNESLLAIQVFVCVTAVTLYALIAALNERRRAETANRELNQEILHRRQLGWEVFERREMENRLLGEELHDNLSQKLLGIALVSKRMEHRWAESFPEEAQEAARVTGLIHEVMSLVRRLSRGLYPLEVQAGGLLPALKQLASTTSHLGEVRCEFSCDSPPPVPDDAATQLYHIAQEAVGNALKHSQARLILVRLSQKGSELTLSVRDNGMGIREPRPEDNGLGLAIMRNRAARMGARLDITSHPGEGTAVVCSLRLTPAAAALEISP